MSLLYSIFITFFKTTLESAAPPGVGPRARALFAYRLTGPIHMYPWEEYNKYYIYIYTCMHAYV